MAERQWFGDVQITVAELVVVGDIAAADARPFHLDLEFEGPRIGDDSRILKEG